LAPPPESLLKAWLFSSVVKPLGLYQNCEAAMVSTGNKVHNNQQQDVIDVETNEGNENNCPASVKKQQHTTIAFTPSSLQL
jgi:hypothetical protein